MKKLICQSCGMPMDSTEVLATNKDGRNKFSSVFKFNNRILADISI